MRIRLFDANVAGLPLLYDQLGSQLTAQPISLPPDRVYITEYMDPVRDENGDFCDQEILEESVNLPGVGISAAEAEWASTKMLVELNRAVLEASSRSGWSYISGIYALFEPHGYCSSDRWIVQFTESVPNQGNKDGTIHPNFQGHEAFAERLASEMTQGFYTGGDLTKPRHPTP